MQPSTTFQVAVTPNNCYCHHCLTSPHKSSYIQKRLKKWILWSGNCHHWQQKCYRNPFFGRFETPKGYGRHHHRFLGKVKFFQLNIIRFRGQNSSFPKNVHRHFFEVFPNFCLKVKVRVKDICTFQQIQHAEMITVG